MATLNKQKCLIQLLCVVDDEAVFAVITSGNDSTDSSNYEILSEQLTILKGVYDDNKNKKANKKQKKPAKQINNKGNGSSKKRKRNSKQRKHDSKKNRKKHKRS